MANNKTQESQESPPEPTQDTTASTSHGPALNRVELLGRLAADPDVRYLAEGKPVANLRLATNERAEPEFHSLVCFGQPAEFAASYLGKGRLVFAEGRLHTNSWTDGAGERHFRVEVQVQRLQALDRPAQPASSA